MGHKFTYDMKTDKSDDEKKEEKEEKGNKDDAENGSDDTQVSGMQNSVKKLTTQTITPNVEASTTNDNDKAKIQAFAGDLDDEASDTDDVAKANIQAITTECLKAMYERVLAKIQDTNDNDKAKIQDTADGTIINQQVLVETFTGKTITIRKEASDTINSIKEKILAKGQDITIH